MTNKDYYPLSGPIPCHREPAQIKFFAVVVVILYPLSLMPGAQGASSLAQCV